jgi:hypothetical protein
LVGDDDGFHGSPAFCGSALFSGDTMT